jgi:hypothetical protein
MNSLEFILATLAVWRFRHLIAAEDGPFELIAWLRRNAATGFWGRLLDCFYCLSIWIAIPFAIWLGGSRWQKFLMWPALSGAAILLNRIADRLAPDAPICLEEPKAKHEGGLGNAASEGSKQIDVDAV